ncbi:hypothetical protein B1R32_11710 [Abditibacterium utsteinense]|uniref:Uncharacterized protein n=1 Tax=Abditibacterium utsteinense TaxID=1960156 RepID=A0A2S8SQB1_9BACT|nr:hypothetical protein [Abditibacterium utsteinense]PQV62968.1 hypothetical protein B1R32_11710 [Abditibacterium utsteinense]
MTPTKAPLNGKQKRTYVLATQTLERFEAQVAPGKRGVAVNEAIEHWIEEQRLAKIRADIEAFGRDSESQALYAQIDREWAPLSDEVWAQIDDDWSKMSPEEMDKEFGHGA